MGFGLTKEHHDFFHKNHFIEFEDLLSSKRMDALEKAIDSLVTSEDWIHVGHDVWRRDKSIKKVTVHKGLAEIALSLCKKKTLRLAYDQVIEGPLSKNPLNLIEVSAIRKVVCGLTLQLDPTSSAESPLVPKKRGAGVFFSPFCELDFSKDCHLFMIAYTEKIAQYVYETRAPNMHALKKLNYFFGDRLRANTHPLLA
ncbi:MAG: hypothetical protein P0S93_02420 [Candidatus Neptunochlamydia sp.]|nr:hypothetical protein [Candidatus Neptunochlamydia sp.]